MNKQANPKRSAINGQSNNFQQNCSTVTSVPAETACPGIQVQLTGVRLNLLSSEPKILHVPAPLFCKCQMSSYFANANSFPLPLNIAHLT